MPRSPLLGLPAVAGAVPTLEISPVLMREGHGERTYVPYLTAIIGTSAKSGLAFERAGLRIFPRNFIRRTASTPKSKRLRPPVEYL